MKKLCLNFTSFKRLFAISFFVLIFTLFFHSNSLAVAGINRTINFQGKLVNNPLGTNVNNTNYTVVFTIYDDPDAGQGTALWTETQSVTTADGIFRVNLGSVTPFPANFNFNWDGLYLGVKVNADTEMTPRVTLSAVPYAFNAEKVSGLTVQDENGNASTSGTLRIGNGKTVTISSGLTFSGTDGKSFVFPNLTGASDDIVTEDFVQTLTNKTIGSSGLTFSGATVDITTGTDQDFRIDANGTGGLILSDSSITLSGFAGNNAILYAQVTTGTLTAATTSIGGQCLVSGNGAGYAPSWGSCSAGGGSNWDVVSGAIAPKLATTLDFLIGGTSTASAKFAFTGISDLNNQTQASISGQLVVMPNNGYSGKVGIGTTNPTTTLDVNGNITSWGYILTNQGYIDFTNAGASPGSLQLGQDGSGAIFTTGTLSAYNLTLSGASGYLTITGGNSPASNQIGIGTDGTDVATGGVFGAGGFKILGTTGYLDISNAANNPGAGQLGYEIDNSHILFGSGISVSGGNPASGKALAIFNQIEDQDIFTASKSGTTRFVITKDGSIGINMSNPSQKLDITHPDETGYTEIRGTSYGVSGLTNSVFWTGRAARGTKTSPAAVQQGDSLLTLGGQGYGSSFTSDVSTRLQFFADETWSTNSYGGYITLTTNRNGGNNPTERLRIGSSGQVGIGTTTATSQLSITRPLSWIATGKVLAVFDQIENQDIFTASAGGTTRFTISNAGALGISSGYGSNGECLKSGGSAAAAVTWGACGAGGGGSNWVLNSTAGTIYPINTTLDLILGGVASSSAKFLFTNMNTGNPTLKIFNSASTQSLNLYHDGTNGYIESSVGEVVLGSGTGGVIIEDSLSNDTITNDGAVKIADKFLVENTENNLALAVFNNTGTGDLFAASRSGSNRFVITGLGNVGIGTVSPLSSLHVTRPLSFTANGKSLATFDQYESTDIFTASASGTTRFTITSQGGISLGANGLYVGSNGECLKSGGPGAAATWGSCLTGLTPWTADIDADGYDLTDLSNIQFRETTGAPAGSVIAIYSDNTGDINLNSLTGKTINLQVNGTDEYNFSSSALAMNANNITGLGTNLTASAGLTIGTGSNNNISLSPDGSGVVAVLGDADTNLQVTFSAAPTVDMVAITNTGQGTSTTAIDGLSVNFTNAGSGVITNAGLQIDVTSNNTNASSILYGLNIANLTSGGESSSEIALRIGSGWDQGIVIENGSNDGTGFVYTNGGRPTKTITLSPEYPGAIITASGSATTNGSMTSDASGSATLSNFSNYYEWTSSQTSLQDYVVAVRVKLPADFSAWATATSAAQIKYNTELANNTSNKLDVFIYNGSKTLSFQDQGTPVVYRQAVSSNIQKTWNNLDITSGAIDSGLTRDLDEAGEDMIIYFKLYSKDNNHVQIGDIVLNYLAKF